MEEGRGTKRMPNWLEYREQWGHGCESRVGGRLGPDHAGPLRPRCFQAMGKPQKLGDKEEGVGICTLDHSGFQNVSVKEAQGSRMPTEVPGE